MEYQHPIYSCPNGNITFTCQDNSVSSMERRVEPYFTEKGYLTIKYVSQRLAVNDTGTYPMNRSDVVFTHLINITRINTYVADMTSTLTIVTSGVTNGTKIQCQTVKGRDIPLSSTFLYLSGIIIWQ